MTTETDWTEFLYEVIQFDHIDRAPLMIAVQHGDQEMVRLPIAAGADVNAHFDLRAGDTALHSAAANGTLGMVRLLIKAGADPTIQGWMWITPLMQAERRKRGDGPEIYALLERIARKQTRHEVHMGQAPGYQRSSGGGAVSAVPVNRSRRLTASGFWP